MIQLTYISTATKQMSDDEVGRILALSQANNAARNVTGLLVYNGKRFLQTLEGAHADVAATYARITTDARHRALVKLSSQEIAQRVFPSWAMAGLRVSGNAESDELVGIVNALTHDIQDPTVKAHFRSFAAVQPSLISPVA